MEKINLTGKIIFENNWYLLEFAENQEFMDRIKSILDPKYGANKYELTNKLHVSIIKNELPSLKQQKFGKSFVNEYISFSLPMDQLELFDTNQRHIWIELENERLAKMREFFGLPCVTINSQFRVKFHLTLGKIIDPVITNVQTDNSNIVRISQTCYFDLKDMYQRV